MISVRLCYWVCAGHIQKIGNVHSLMENAKTNDNQAGRDTSAHSLIACVRSNYVCVCVLDIDVFIIIIRSVAASVTFTARLNALRLFHTIGTKCHVRHVIHTYITHTSEQV